MKKKKLFLVEVFVIFLISLVGTFAYYTASASNNDAINATAASASLKLTITKEAGGTILVPQLTQYLQSALTGTKGTSCIDGNNNTVCQVYEIIIENTGTSTAVVSGSIELIATMPNLKWEILSGVKTRSNTPITHPKTDTTLVSSLSLASGATKTYYMAVWIEETGSSQNDSGSFNGTVSFNLSNGSGVTSTFIPTASETIIDLATEYENTTASNGVYSVEHNSIAIAESATGVTIPSLTDYRYYGSSPDNYARFNGETWRVIGVFPTQTSTSSEYAYRVKLIKNTALSSTYEFDNVLTADNDYETSSLKAYLNGSYYNNLESNSKSLVDSVIYYTAGYDSSDITTETMYGYERGTSVAITGATNTATYVGLMYPSDYGYASGKTCSSQTTLLNYYKGCGTSSNNWMYQETSEWTISPNTNSAGDGWYLFSDGRIQCTSFVGFSYGVRPVVYLKSKTIIKSGNGTIDNPFVFE